MNDVNLTRTDELARLRESANLRFAQDLPQLLEDHFGNWVAYRGEQRVASARHSAELYDACRRMNLTLDEVMIFEVVSPSQEDPVGPMNFD